MSLIESKKSEDHRRVSFFRGASPISAFVARGASFRFLADRMTVAREFVVMYFWLLVFHLFTTVDPEKTYGISSGKHGTTISPRLHGVHAHERSVTDGKKTRLEIPSDFGPCSFRVNDSSLLQ